MQEISERGRKFIDVHLRMDDVVCYWKKLLLDYSSLLKDAPVKQTGYIEIHGLS